MADVISLMEPIIIGSDTWWWNPQILCLYIIAIIEEKQAVLPSCGGDWSSLIVLCQDCVWRLRHDLSKNSELCLQGLPVALCPLNYSPQKKRYNSRWYLWILEAIHNSLVMWLFAGHSKAANFMCLRARPGSARDAGCSTSHSDAWALWARSVKCLW